MCQSLAVGSATKRPLWNMIVLLQIHKGTAETQKVQTFRLAEFSIVFTTKMRQKCVNCFFFDKNAPKMRILLLRHTY